MFIKDVLREELQNSLQMKANCERARGKLPKGSLVRRIIKGNPYYYLVFREGDRVRSVYKGKVSDQEIERFAEAKQRRIRYREQLAEINKQIRFLRKVLRGKESV